MPESAKRQSKAWALPLIRREVMSPPATNGFRRRAIIPRASNPGSRDTDGTSRCAGEDRADPIAAWRAIAVEL